MSRFPAFEAEIVVNASLLCFRGELFDMDSIYIHGIWVLFLWCQFLVVVVLIFLKCKEGVSLALGNVVCLFPNMFEVESLGIPLFYGGGYGVHWINSFHDLGGDSPWKEVNKCVLIFFISLSAALFLNFEMYSRRGRLFKVLAVDSHAMAWSLVFSRMKESLNLVRKSFQIQSYEGFCYNFPLLVVLLVILLTHLTYHSALVLSTWTISHHLWHMLRFHLMPTILGQTPLFLSKNPRCHRDTTMTSLWHHYDLPMTSLLHYDLIHLPMTSSPEHYKYASILPL